MEKSTDEDAHFYPQTFRISPEAFSKFVKAVNEPPAPTPELVELMRYARELKRLEDEKQ